MGLIIFVSYATMDSKYIDLKNLAQLLENNSQIEKVLIWEEDTNEDIIDYMEKNIAKCDVFLIISTENSKNSESVRLEWKAALNEKKVIIPVFTDEKNIPLLLRSKLGVKIEGNLVHIANSIIEVVKKRGLGQEIDAYQEINGNCIRCSSKIRYDLTKPYCYDCFLSWKDYHNPNYSEQYCHECGERYGATLNHPRCDNCYWK